MKILNVINSFEFGGAENLLYNSIPFYKNHNIQVDFLSLTNKLDLLDGKEIKEIYYLNSTNSKNLKSLFLLLKFISKKKYDIIHCHLFPSIYFISLAKKINLIEVPIIMTEHNTKNRRRNLNFMKPIEKFIYKEFDKIICISKGTSDKLVEWIPELENKINIVNNGIDLKKFKHKKHCNINSKDEIKIIMVASFSSQKDQTTLIKAMTEVSAKYKLYFAGDGKQINKSKSLVRKLNLEDRINFLGNQSNIPELLSQMDLFVLSSNWEGFGLVVIEAMASGLPVIATDVPGVSNIVSGYGELFECGDYLSLAKKIKKMTSNTKIYNNFCRKSIKRAEDFSIENMLEEYIAIYSKLIENN
jgi:hypothetical protein